MKSMALAGEKNTMRDGEWVVTMLMCLRWQRSHLERVQVMDCQLNELCLLEAGAKKTTVDTE